MRWIGREPFWAAECPPRERRVIAVAILVVMASLIFARLGTYALWDDEANTALYGEAVWRTGDTSAVHGDNVIAYRDGVELDRELRNRLVAPLPYYVEAPFIRETASPFFARLPFALAGVAALALGLRWMDRTRASRRVWAMTAIAVVGNVAWILFCRQARYYGLAMLCTMAVGYGYAHREQGRRMLVLMSAAAAALLATHYLCYAGLAAAITVDYVVWGRKSGPIAPRSLAAITLSQLVVGVPIVATWYPLGKEIAARGSESWVADRLHLWLITLRDLNTCELGVGLLMLAAPLLYRRTRDPLLHRLPVAIATATLVVTVFSPQPGTGLIADIRYVSFLIPACVLLGIRTLAALPLPGPVSVVAALVAFQTTAVQWVLARAFEPPIYEVPLRSTLVAYLGELRDPPPTPYGLAAEWIRRNTRPGETAVVRPDFAIYPMMVHAPGLVYGWQLSAARAAQLPALAPIHVHAKVAPDWLIIFGRFPGPTAEELGGAVYDRAAVLPINGVDATRPELSAHQFVSPPFNPTFPLTIWRRHRP